MLTKTFAVAYYTFRESFARKTFIAFFIISTIILSILLLAVNIDVVDGALASFRFFNQDVKNVDQQLRLIIIGIQSTLSAFLFTGGIFFSIFATASLVPNMLEKGNIDWLLARPISRSMLLFGRSAGALAVVAFNVFYLVGGAWLILSLKSGFWHWPFLLSGLIIVLTFAVLYAFMVFLGVAVQNSAVTIMGAYLILFFSPMLAQRDRIYALLTDKVWQYLLDVLYIMTPRTFEVGDITRLVVMNQPIASWNALWHSLALGVVYFFLAILIFNKKDY